MPIVNVFENDYSTLSKLWSKHTGHKLTNVMTLFYDNLKRGLPLVVGLNPSYDKHIKTFSRDILGKSENFYEDNSNAIKELALLSCREHEYARQQNSGKFFKLCNGFFGENYEFIDIFRFRCTKADDAINLMDKMNPTFKNEQLQLFEKTVEQLNPSLILASNATASRLFYNNESCDRKDLHRLGILRLRKTNTPIFLSGQLYGGADSSFAKERVRWHMRFIINECDIRNGDGNIPTILAPPSN